MWHHGVELASTCFTSSDRRFMTIKSTIVLVSHTARQYNIVFMTDTSHLITEYSTLLYSGTSNKGPSGKETTSLQRTLPISPKVYTSEKRTAQTKWLVPLLGVSTVSSLLLTYNMFVFIDKLPFIKIEMNNTSTLHKWNSNTIWERAFASCCWLCCSVPIIIIDN